MALPASKAKERDTERREEILEAAAKLFSALGYERADTQRLADELGVGKGTLYRHFASKRELFLATADRAMRRLHDRVEASMEGVDEPLERIARAVAAYLDHFAESPESVELLIQERAQFRDRTRPTYFEYRRRSVVRWRELYRSLIKEGRVRDIPVERISDVFAAVLYGTIFLKHFAGGSETFAASPEDILDVMFFGILSDEERARLGHENPPAPRQDKAGDPKPAGAPNDREGP